MHQVLRQRLLRKIESLPEEQMYQVLDYIEFLESKYARDLQAEATGLQRFAENLEDRLRKRAVSPTTIREAFQLIAAADRVLSSVSTAGRQLFQELGSGLESGTEDDGGRSVAEVAGGSGPPGAGRPQGARSRPPGAGRGAGGAPRDVAPGSGGTGGAATRGGRSAAPPSTGPDAAGEARGRGEPPPGPAGPKPRKRPGGQGEGAGSP